MPMLKIEAKKDVVSGYTILSKSQKNNLYNFFTDKYSPLFLT